MKKPYLGFFLFSAITLCLHVESTGQIKKGIFTKVPLDSMGIKGYQLLCSQTGNVFFTSSIGLFSMKGRQISGPSVSYERGSWKKQRDFTAEDSIRAICEGKDSLLFYATHDNMILFIMSHYGGGWGIPPFYFPPKEGLKSNISKLWVDAKGDLFVGTLGDGFFIIKEGAKKSSWNYKIELTKDSNIAIKYGEKEVLRHKLNPTSPVFAFAEDTIRKLVWIGTGNGLFKYHPITSQIEAIENKNKANCTITDIQTDEAGNLWFSTLEHGMGYYNIAEKAFQFYPYKKTNKNSSTLYPIKAFCRKSPVEFFVAIMDSVPAIFNTERKIYRFIKDSTFEYSPNRTTDIDADKAGNLFLIKGDDFYFAKTADSRELTMEYQTDSSLLAPFIRSVVAINGENILDVSIIEEKIPTLKLPYDENTFIVNYDIVDYSEKSKIRFAWKVDGYTYGWIETPSLNMDSSNFALIDNLKPGRYLFEVKVKIGDEDWRTQMAKMKIVIIPPYWQSWWFWAGAIIFLFLSVYYLVRQRVRSVRKAERLKASHEKELLELEARALRAQMNPHFVFNCLNSIKALILSDEKQMAVDYLTTFSKLIRTLFQNSDKRLISLYDEIETCRLYIELEAMRLNGNLKYKFIIDPDLDLKSVQVPALIIQPFVENSIWHGIVPKNEGNICITVTGDANSIICEVEDDGIGRKLSMLSKPPNNTLHESKGVHLSQSRLQLEKIMNDTNSTIEIMDKSNDDKVSGTIVRITFFLT